MTTPRVVSASDDGKIKVWCMGVSGATCEATVCEEVNAEGFISVYAVEGGIAAVKRGAKVEFYQRSKENIEKWVSTESAQLGDGKGLAHACFSGSLCVVGKPGAVEVWRRGGTEYAELAAQKAQQDVHAQNAQAGTGGDVEMSEAQRDSQSVSCSWGHACGMPSGMRLVRGVCVSENGKLVAACDSDGHVAVWDSSSGGEEAIIKWSRLAAGCWSCVFARGVLGNVVMVTCEDGYARAVRCDVPDIIANAADEDARLESIIPLSGGPGELPEEEEDGIFEVLWEDGAWKVARLVRMEGARCFCVLEGSWEKAWVDAVAVRRKSIPFSEGEEPVGGSCVLVRIPRGAGNVHYDADLIEYVPGGGLQGFFGVEGCDALGAAKEEPYYRIRFLHGRDEGVSVLPPLYALLLHKSCCATMLLREWFADSEFVFLYRSTHFFSTLYEQFNFKSCALLDLL